MTLHFTRFIRSLTVLGAAVAAVGAGQAWAQGIVVQTSGPSAASYPVGRKLADGARLTLVAADTITVLGKDGTRVLRGPGLFTIGEASSAASNNRLAGFVSRKGSATRVRTGAVRGDPAASDDSPPAAPNLWIFDVRHGGPFCLVEGVRPMMWRPDADQEAAIELVPAGGGTPVRIEWAEQSRFKAWPADLAPPAGGDAYSFTPPGGASSLDVRFHPIAEPPAELDAIADLLLASGCRRQFDLLVEVAAQAEAETGSGG